MELNVNIAEGVCFLKLNRPSVYNSFNRLMAIRVQEELERCSIDEDIRVVVLTGEGKAFCAGQDLEEATTDNGLSLEVIIDEHYNPIIKK